MQKLSQFPDSVIGFFPNLTQKIHGKKLVYLDNGATTLKHIKVIDEVNKYQTEYSANVHRGIHYMSEKATLEYEACRDKLAQFLNAKTRQEIIFTKGTTESINLLAYSFGQLLKEGDEIVISGLEHHSNIVPWQLLCQRAKTNLKVIPLNEHGELDLTNIDSIITNKTKIVSVNWISNSLGTINPIEQLITLAHNAGAAIHLDAAQASAHKIIDVQKLDVDFLSFSAHKMYGPTGVGVLYGKSSWLNLMPPFLGGGDMIDVVSFEETTFNTLPYKFEAGTPNISGVIGFAKAIDFLNTLDFKAMAEYELSLLNYTREKMSQIPGLREIGTAKNKSNIFSFVIDGVHPQDLATYIDQQGVAIRTGHHCTQPVMKHFNISSTARASISIYNTKEDIDILFESTQKALQILL